MYVCVCVCVWYAHGACGVRAGRDRELSLHLGRLHKTAPTESVIKLTGTDRLQTVAASADSHRAQ